MTIDYSQFSKHERARLNELEKLVVQIRSDIDKLRKEHDTPARNEMIAGRKKILAGYIDQIEEIIGGCYNCSS